MFCIRSSPLVAKSFLFALSVYKSANLDVFQPNVAFNSEVVAPELAINVAKHFRTPCAEHSFGRPAILARSLNQLASDFLENGLPNCVSTK